MTPPISLRALLEVEARVRQTSLARQADLEAMSMFGLRAREAARPLCEALQEAIAALEEIGQRISHGDHESNAGCTRCLATAALARIREKVAP